MNFLANYFNNLFFKKSSPIIKVQLELIYELQVKGDFESINKLLNIEKLNKPKLAEEYCVFLLEKYNGTLQRTQYGPLLINREVVYYYNEFVTKILL
jgi:hypothetical protein